MLVYLINDFKYKTSEQFFAYKTDTFIMLRAKKTTTEKNEVSIHQNNEVSRKKNGRLQY